MHILVLICDKYQALGLNDATIETNKLMGVFTNLLLIGLNPANF